MTKFYQPYKDNSKETIEKTAEFLNKKPNRQGSNQSLSDVKPAPSTKENKK